MSKLDLKIFQKNHEDAEIENLSESFNKSEPRLGRRESEPHSIEITYLYDLLKTNFPECRVMWDLHHYFHKKNKKIDLQYDISFFKDFNLPEALSSYESKDFDDRIPDLAINILSKSTWKKDFLEHVDMSQELKIPVYLIFPSYHVTTQYYEPPFLRVYVLQTDGSYKNQELREITILENTEGEIVKVNPKAIIDVGDKLPFRFALMKRKQKHHKGLPLFRVVLLKMDSFELLHTFSEMETIRADEEKERADKAEEELRILKKKYNL